MKKLICISLFILAAIAAAQTNRFPPINLYTGDPTGTPCTIPNSLVQSTTTEGIYGCTSGGTYAPLPPDSSKLPLTGGTITGNLNVTGTVVAGIPDLAPTDPAALRSAHSMRVEIAPGDNHAVIYGSTGIGDIFAVHMTDTTNGRATEYVKQSRDQANANGGGGWTAYQTQLYSNHICSAGGVGTYGTSTGTTGQYADDISIWAGGIDGACQNDGGVWIGGPSGGEWEFFPDSSIVQNMDGGGIYFGHNPGNAIVKFSNENANSFVIRDYKYPAKTRQYFNLVPFGNGNGFGEIDVFGGVDSNGGLFSVKGPITTTAEVQTPYVDLTWDNPGPPTVTGVGRIFVDNTNAFYCVVNGGAFCDVYARDILLTADGGISMGGHTILASGLLGHAGNGNYLQTGDNTGTSGTIAVYGTGSVLTSSGALPQLSGVTGSIGGSALTVGQCATGTASISGANGGVGYVSVAQPSNGNDPGPGMYWKAFISSSNVVTVNVCAAVAGTPTATTYYVKVIR